MLLEQRGEAPGAEEQHSGLDYTHQKHAQRCFKHLHWLTNTIKYTIKHFWSN